MVKIAQFLLPKLFFSGLFNVFTLVQGDFEYPRTSILIRRSNQGPMEVGATPSPHSTGLALMGAKSYISELFISILYFKW